MSRNENHRKKKLKEDHLQGVRIRNNKYLSFKELVHCGWTPDDYQGNEIVNFECISHDRRTLIWITPKLLTHMLKIFQGFYSNWTKKFTSRPCSSPVVETSCGPVTTKCGALDSKFWCCVLIFLASEWGGDRILFLHSKGIYLVATRMLNLR